MGAVRERVRAVTVAGRTPPHDEGSEAAVLSAAMYSAEAFDAVRATNLREDEFYFDAHKRIFGAMLAVAEESAPVDFATIGAKLQQRGHLSAIGGIGYLTKLIDSTPAPENVAAHATIVRDFARRRAFLETLAFAQGRAWEHKGSTDALIADSLAELDEVATTGAPKLIDAFDAVSTRWAELEAQWAGTREATGLPSCLPGLQPILGGYRLKGCSVLAAATGGGKSSAALQEVLHLAGREHNGEKVGCVVVSLEMDAGENIDRAMAIESGVPDTLIQSGAMEQSQRDALHDAANRIAQKPIWFETSEVDLHGIRSAWRRADREMQKHGNGRRVRFVLVDFLGLVRLEDAERHDIALTNLTRGLKLFAMAENVHVMILCQFNRGSADRDPWAEPQLRDLKDSSGTEQNANQVIFVHRVECAGAEDYAGIVVAKNRKGEKGRTRAKFDGACYRFVAPYESDVERWRQARDASKPQRRKRS